MKMIQDLEDALKGKWNLFKITSYGGHGGYESEVIKVADTKEELIEYCEENGLNYKGSWSDYGIGKY
jgi:hypothetical protein